ncbi:MAG TPA: CAP domain-containing protein [Chthonomonadaceae bacterium]|nr:CAP domain-containing protein [Chthonomonadaceae bacterium]
MKLSTGFLPACALAWLLSGAPAGTQDKTAGTPSKEERFLQEIVERTNAERDAQGLPPLKLQENLSASASWLANDMAAKGYFAHTDKQGRNIQPRLPDFGYTHYAYIGENIAAGQATPAAVMRGWMNSPVHRDDLLNPHFREIGVGYVYRQNSPFRHYWVQDFGARYGVYPVVINGEAAQTRNPYVQLYIYGEGWAQRMRLSNDGVNWTPWQPYTARLDWELEPGSGPRTVTVELSNGEEVTRAADSITLLGPEAETAPTRQKPAKTRPQKPRRSSK